jgi:hypothetical protein
MLGVTVECLRKWRVAGKGPAFVRETRRSTIYRVTDVDEWLAKSVQRTQITERRKRRTTTKESNGEPIG